MGSVRVGSARWPLPAHLVTAARAQNAGAEVAYGVRHRDLMLAHYETPGSVHGIVYAVEPTGDLTYVHIRVGGDPVVASVAPEETFMPMRTCGSRRT